MKFKIGDKVRIKSNLTTGERRNGLTINRSMVGYVGEEATITEVIHNDYKLNIDKGDWYWGEDMLELVEEKEEVKDKEWLEEKVEKLKKINLENWERAEPNGKDQMFFYGCLAAYENVLGFVDELVEPEITEEQAWYFIAKKYNQDGSYWFDARNHYLNTIGKVMVEKPEIPQFVADYIVNMKKGNRELRHILNNVQHNYAWDYMCEIDEWVINNEKKFVEAWYYGYTVKEEPKYFIPLDVAKNGRNEVYLYKNFESSPKGRLDVDWSLESYIRDQENKHLYQFTEEEIEKFDPRFLAFKEPVIREED